MGDMGRWRALVFVALCGLLSKPSLAVAAACATSGQPAATITLDDPKLGGTMLANLAIWTELMAQKGLAHDLDAQGSRCERVRIKTQNGAYVLRGDDGDAGGLARVAVPEQAGAPLVYLTPVPDFSAAMTPGHTGPAPIQGYALMTTTAEAQTAWRLYDKIPVDGALASDIADALAGRIRPLMRVRGDNVEIIVPDAKTR